MGSSVSRLKEKSFQYGKNSSSQASKCLDGSSSVRSSSSESPRAVAGFLSSAGRSSEVGTDTTDTSSESSVSRATSIPPSVPRPFPSQRAAAAPTNALLTLIRQRDWDAVLSHIHTVPRDATFRDYSSSSGTPLHLATLYRAPLLVVTTLLQVYPAAVTIPDTEGWIPLHVALLYPHKDDPAVCLAILRVGGPASAARYTPHGMAAVHLACGHGADTRILEAIVAASPEQVGSSEALTAAGTLLHRRYRRERKSISNNDGGGGGASHHEEGSPAYLMDRQMLEHLQILIRATKGHYSRSNDSISATDITLHDVVEFQRLYGVTVVAFDSFCDCVADFLTVYLRFHPKAATVRNIAGDLPLHAIAAVPAEATPYITDIVLNAYPDASTLPDARGRLPLHVALETLRSHWRYEREYTVEIGTRSWNLRFRTVRLLQAAHPAAVGKRWNGLVPFQMAALAEAPTGNDNSANADALSLVYELLRPCPHFVCAMAEHG